MQDMYRCFFVFAAVLVRAQNPSDTNPMMRTSTQLVQVNVIVHDKNGPVGNLTKGDFILTERGKPRAINLFSVESPAGLGKSAEGLPPNTFSNRENRPGARFRNVVIVLLDGINTRFEGKCCNFDGRRRLD
jgi:hypothetical protein